MLVHQLFEENVTIETWIKRINKQHAVGRIDNAAQLRLRKKDAAYVFPIRLGLSRNEQQKSAETVQTFARNLKLFCNALKENVPSFIGFEYSKDKKFLPLNDSTCEDIVESVSTPYNGFLFHHYYSLIFDGKNVFQVKDLSIKLSQIFNRAGEETKLVSNIDYSFNPKASKGVFTAVGPSGALKKAYSYSANWNTYYPTAREIPQLNAVEKLVKKLRIPSRKDYGKFAIQPVKAHAIAKNGSLVLEIVPSVRIPLALHGLTSDEEFAQRIKQAAAKQNNKSLDDAVNGAMSHIEKAGDMIDYVLIYPKSLQSYNIPENVIKLPPSQVTAEKIVSQFDEKGICVALHVDPSEIESPNDMDILSKLLAAAEPGLNEVKESLPESRTMSWEIATVKGIPTIKIEVK